MRDCGGLSVIGVLLFLFPCCWGYEILDKISGSVSGGEANFYKLDTWTISVLCLITEEGDADLYVARTSLTPSPGADLYEHSATSTGTDLVVLVEQEPVTIGVHGHVRCETSSYHLLVLVPNEEEILHHQVWELNPETMRKELIIDIDPLWLANDPHLHATVHRLYHGDAITGQLGSLATALEWIFWFLLKLLQFAIEVLL